MAHVSHFAQHEQSNRVFQAHQGTGSLMFTGPITASTVRKIACDTDIIPVVLGGDGRAKSGQSR